MINTFPKYYKKFACIADKCPDTCCAGWEIVVDGESLERYNKLKGSFGDKIRSLIETDDDDDRIFAPQNARCPFLLEDGLCEMYIELGHDSLCRTCRMFPRHVTYFGARSETGISLSCPEAAKIIMESSEPITFETEETHASIMPTAIEPDLYFTLIEARKTAINIIQNRDFSIQKRICVFLALSEKIHRLIRKNQFEEARKACKESFLNPEACIFNAAKSKRALKKYFSDFKSLEMLDADWKTALETAEYAESADIGTFEWEYEHLMIYFIFRYFMTAVFDGDLLSKAKFAAVSFIIICRLQAERINSKSARTTAMQKFSKEVEHSAQNMYYLISSIKKSRFYSTENIINILSETEEIK